MMTEYLSLWGENKLRPISFDKMFAQGLRKGKLFPGIESLTIN